MKINDFLLNEGHHQQMAARDEVIFRWEKIEGCSYLRILDKVCGVDSWSALWWSMNHWWRDSRKSIRWFQRRFFTLQQIQPIKMKKIKLKMKTFFLLFFFFFLDDSSAESEKSTFINHWWRHDLMMSSPGLT